MRTMLSVCAVAVLLAMTGCKAKLETSPCVDEAKAGDVLTCDVPGYENRAYDLIVPPGYAGEPIPVLLAFHGGGGNKEGALRTTCPDGNLENDSCLHAHAAQRGYALVLPNGTEDNVLPNTRTWNAGGGVGDYRCTSGDACEMGVDDVAYVRTLLDHVGERVTVDPKRVYSTGLSNGGAISHRLACEMSDRIAAIFPIGGAMQLTVSDACAPSRPVPVMHAHGTNDTCWHFEGGTPSCGGGITGQRDKIHVSVERTMQEWAEINRCGPAQEGVALPDQDPNDSTETFRVDYEGCTAPTALLRIENGGHTWPSGQQYLGERLVGAVPRDWGNEVLFDWFDANPMP